MMRIIYHRARARGPQHPPATNLSFLVSRTRFLPINSWRRITGVDSKFPWLPLREAMARRRLDMVASVLMQRWRTLKTEGNFNNRIGVPHTLFRLTARHQAAVIEMGVDHRGQTTRLCEIARPTIGLITNIGPDHLEFFGSMEGSAQAKAELLDMLPVTGTAVRNTDDPYFDYLAARAQCRVISFGLS